MTNLCREAALGPIRSLTFEEMETITAEQVKKPFCRRTRAQFKIICLYCKPD